MKKQIQTISSTHKDIFDINVNQFLSNVNHEKHDVKLHYQASRSNQGVEFYSLMIETTEKSVNPLMEAINGYREKSTDSTNNL